LETQYDLKCAAGRVCDFGTTPAAKDDLDCPPGFYCYEGTGWSSRFRNPCPKSYFCPNGTTSGTPTTKCPEGTTSLLGSISEDDCFKDGNPKLATINPTASTFEADPVNVFGESLEFSQLGDNVTALVVKPLHLVRMQFNWTGIPPEMIFNFHYNMEVSSRDGAVMAMPFDFLSPDTILASTYELALLSLTAAGQMSYAINIQHGTYTPIA
jgi:hypothetical protein